MSQDVVPFYVICDESYSMREHAEVLLAQLDELFGVLATHRCRAETRTSVIGFARTPRLLSPLHSGVATAFPTMGRSDASSNFGAAFELVRDRAAADRRLIVAEGRRTRPPVVLFFSDGLPTDPASWPAAHRALNDDDVTIVAFAVGDADVATLRRIDPSGVFTGSVGRRPGQVVDAIATRLA